MKVLIIAVAISLLAIKTLASDHDERCIPDPAQVLEADINNDRVVTRDEVSERRATMFRRLDRNGDGFADMSDPPRFARTRYAGVLERLLPGFDANSDERLSRAEFVDGPTPGFDRADLNGDDRLDADELSGLDALAC